MDYHLDQDGNTPDAGNEDRRVMARHRKQDDRPLLCRWGWHRRNEIALLGGWPAVLRYLHQCPRCDTEWVEQVAP